MKTVSILALTINNIRCQFHQLFTIGLCNFWRQNVDEIDSRTQNPLRRDIAI